MSEEPPRFIMVVTYGRSGSTLLMGILDTINGANVRGENYNTLLHLFRSIRSAERSRYDFGKHPTTRTDPWYGADQIDCVGYRQALLDAFNQNILRAAPGDKVLGFKEIRYGPGAMTDDEFTHFLDFVLNEIPKSLIIVNTRDIEETSTSAWYAKDPNSREYLSRFDARIRTYAKNNKARVAHLHYDDYVKDISVVAVELGRLGLHIDESAVKKLMKKTHSSKTERKPAD